MVSIAFVCRSLSGATLACAEESSRLEKAIEHAFTELDRQVERHVAHLRTRTPGVARSGASACGNSRRH